MEEIMRGTMKLTLVAMVLGLFAGACGGNGGHELPPSTVIPPLKPGPYLPYTQTTSSGSKTNQTVSGSVGSCTKTSCTSAGGAFGDDASDYSVKLAEIKNAEIKSRQADIMARYPMDSAKAEQFAQLTSKMEQAMARGNGQMTPEETAAYADAAMSVACVSTAEVNAAITTYTNGDRSSFNRLADKAAKCVNLKDPSKVKEILPAYTGVTLPE
jgi:predicted small lipoprotein YifL